MTEPTTEAGPADTEPKFVPVDLTDLANAGVLMAANERFFWPLGLALAWTKNENGSMTDLHVRQWEYGDGHHETIEDSTDTVARQRQAAFNEWLTDRIASLPTSERSGAEALREARATAPAGLDVERLALTPLFRRIVDDTRRPRRHRPARRDPGQVLVLLALTAERLRHPRMSYRNLMARITRRPWPSIGTMTPDEFSAYVKRSGIEAHLIKTLSQGGGTSEDQDGPVRRLQGPSQGPER